MNMPALAASLCGMPQEPQAKTPDLSGLYCFEFVTSTDVGLVDVAGSELMPEALQKQIEADALVAKLEDDEHDKDEGAIARYEDRMAFA